MQKSIKNSLSAKVFLWVFCLLSVSCTIVYGIIFALLPKQFDIGSYDEMEQNVYRLARDLEGMHSFDCEYLINDFCRIYNASVTLESNGEIRSFGSINFENESSSVVCAETTEITHFLDKSAPYTVTVQYLSRSATVITGVMLRLLPVVVAGILVLSFLSAFICSRVIVNPIRKISVISKKMTELGPQCKCDVNRSDEIGVLADSLNTMASRLNRTMNELKDANEHLKEDVERSKLIEQQRRDFFIAVSHELKTPLTVLKGRLENMMLGYGDYSDHDKYLPMAYDTAEDIERLVKEIILITKTENVDISSSLCEVSLVQTIEDAVQGIMPIADERDITIHQQLTQDVTLTVDKNLWGKAVSNIVGNAVRHSPDGAQVYIELENSDGRQTLVVTNTGAAIPEEDMKHLFTPFYRADKSRNRATGGSGLGLYIVKTILDMHGMKCSISNTENGVAFRVVLPDAQNKASKRI